jgi:hypothetical protein
MRPDLRQGGYFAKSSFPGTTTYRRLVFRNRLRRRKAFRYRLFPHSTNRRSAKQDRLCGWREWGELFPDRVVAFLRFKGVVQQQEGRVQDVIWPSTYVLSLATRPMSAIARSCSVMLYDEGDAGIWYAHLAHAELLREYADADGDACRKHNERLRATRHASFRARCDPATIFYRRAAVGALSGKSVSELCVIVFVLERWRVACGEASVSSPSRWRIQLMLVRQRPQRQPLRRLQRQLRKDYAEPGCDDGNDDDYNVRNIEGHGRTTSSYVATTAAIAVIMAIVITATVEPH